MSHVYNEIEKLLKQSTLTSWIADEVHDVRELGNIAADPMKNKQTDQIVAVESGEAEAMLDVVDSLIDFYFVAPAEQKARQAATDTKVQSTKKTTTP